MAIEFKTPEKIKKSVSQAQLLAEFGMRPDSRALDEHEHERPQRFVQMIWPQMQAMEQANLRSALARAQHKNGELNGSTSRNGANEGGAKAQKEPRTDTLELVHMIEMLSWGDAGIYLCIPGGGLGGAAINAVGTPEQLERFMRRFCENEPKWGAMAMTEPQAGSDTSNIQTTARFDAETNEWVLNGQKIFCTNGKLALEESDGFVVVWATVDKQAGRAGMKSFVVEAHTPGVTIAKVEEKLGIRASDTAAIMLDNARIPAQNVLGSAEVAERKSTQGFKGAMKTFDATRPIVAASAIGIARAAFEFARDTLAKEGVQADYVAPRWKLSTVQADLLEMEVQLRAAWLLTLKATALLDAGEENKLESSMCKVKAGKVVTWITQKAVELLGPLGYSTEMLVEKWMRDAKINDIYEGTGQINTLIVARQILGYTRAELK
ncbi:MAG: acyl-CoA dehydrogenase family protein [Caldilineaceae bacterium]|nr:acyl-CoA dehydrogenase family protein [Caldilineaceae bacterium]MCB0141690.1 acyl-CoA dehydrogenase family protein [Caldilineaceae bacterium]